ncbi:MAG: glycosyl transferase family 1 [Marinobacter sp.]|nr:glycosyl transferase family 1 [Marinobacter sp.]
MEPILFVIDHFRNPNAGTEGQLFNLVSRLDRQKFDPRLLVFTDSEYLRSSAFPCDYDVLGSSSLSSAKTWWLLWRYAKAFRGRGGRLAHVFFNDPSVICPPVFRLQGIRTLISRRDMGYWYTPVWRAVLKLTGRFVSLAVANSQAVKELTAKSESLNPDKIEVIYNGYDADRTVPSIPADIEQLKAGHQNAVFIALVANIRPIKRIQDAVEAISGKGCRSANLHLVILGDGDSKHLRQLARNRQIESRVHFLGGRTDVKACLKHLDIGLLCSESEGFSNSIIEYMQAGLPVVCSRVGGNPEAVSHGETGFLYPCGDVSQLEKLLCELGGDTELRRSVGESAKQVAQERFGMDRMVSEHELVYLRVSALGEG